MKEDDLKELYEVYADQVYYYLLGKSGSEDTAFDLMQETFLRANAYYKNVENIKAWLFTIARNQFIDYMKKKQKQKETIQDNDFFSNYSAEDNFEKNVEWKQLKKSILDCLKDQNPIYPEIFLLRVDYEMTHKEISYVINIPFRTIRRHFDKIRSIIFNNFKRELNISFFEGQEDE